MSTKKNNKIGNLGIIHELTYVLLTNKFRELTTFIEHENNRRYGDSGQELVMLVLLAEIETRTNQLFLIKIEMDNKTDAISYCSSNFYLKELSSMALFRNELAS